MKACHIGKLLLKICGAILYGVLTVLAVLYVCTVLIVLTVLYITRLKRYSLDADPVATRIYRFSPDISATIFSTEEARKKEEAWLEQEPEATFLTHRVGYKTWKIYKKDGRFVLYSGYGHTEWKPREKLVARCLGCDHEAPYPTCRCGIHAMDSMDDITKNLAKNIARYTFAGEVKLWGGATLEYSEGVRAPFAYPLSIRKILCGVCVKYVEVEKASYYYSAKDWGGVIALCVDDDKDVVRDPEHYSEKLDPSFLSQISEDYGIIVG